MKKSEITELENKDLQLRYYLGGLQLISNGDQLCDYWTCDINCSCKEVPDDERIIEIKKFIDKHKLTNERFIKLSYNFLTGGIMKYNGEYTPLFIELGNVLMPYNFIHKNSREIPDNDFREKELESIANESVVKEYCTKYQLDITDFISLAKTSLNFRFILLQVKKQSDDFLQELYNIIDSYGLYLTREQVKAYREAYETNQENAQLMIDTKIAQDRYLELMKQLLTEDPNLAVEMISDELHELGLNSRKDVKRLVLSKKQ